MRHQIKKKTLNKRQDHRQAMVQNLVTSLFLHGRMKTTIAKGKVAAQTAEKLLNTIRDDQPFNAIRKLNRVIKDKLASKRIMQEWLPKYKNV
ncbi:MAG: hypothetical protein NTZ80_01455, partial [Patescibacteria group bacterium]|nr:hypothetical protein [Patescibacteria group bacterium]